MSNEYVFKPENYEKVDGNVVLTSNMHLIMMEKTQILL